MAIGGFSKSRNLLARKRLQKRNSARRILLETLEARQLLAVGPQLLGIQPNTGDLLDNGEVLQVSPRELLFRFDDAAGIDPTTLDGIRVVRSGADGLFERATVATDFGTNGQTLVEFYAQEPGEAGNGLQIRFTKAARDDSRAPIVRVNGQTIDVELNSNPNRQTRVEDILAAFDPTKDTPVTRLVYALRLRGSTTIEIVNTVDTTRTYDLSGANAAKASTDFGLGGAVEVRLIARESGNAGLGLTVNVTSRDRGGAANPIVSVTDKTINVELNSNPRFPTTVSEFVNAINASDSQAFGLIEAQLVTGAGATRIGAAPITYSPILFSGVTDVEIIPAYVGLGDTDREVVLRFGEALPDDRYRIEILGQGSRTLRSVDGAAFNQGVSQSVAFELDLGALVESVVPQPVSRNASGNLVQRANEIDVYFNDDDLIDVSSIVSVNGIPINTFRNLRTPLFFQNTDTIVFASGAAGSRSVLDPAYFQLFHTKNSLDSNDDVKFEPDSVRYYPGADRVTLTYRNNLDALRDPVTGVTLSKSELRLRVGTNEAAPLAPVTVTPTTDPADTFSAAEGLTTWTPGSGGSQSVLINSEIRNTTPLELDFPGASDEPGNRINRHQDNLRLTADSEDGTSVQFYNFRGNLGVFSVSTLLNAITEQQKERVREVFSLYERYLGVRFVETDNLGMTIGVGDMRAILPFEEIAGSGIPGVNELNAVGGTYYEAGTLGFGGQLATVLDIQDFSDSTRSEFAGPFQRAAMQAIGRLLGLGLADEVASLTIQSFDSAFLPGVGTEIVLPGDADIVHGQYLYRPDSKDIDLYQFTVPVSGRITIEAFAERMSTASLLDTNIRLYEQNDVGGWEEIAANDDYSSSDSYLQLDLEQGNYIVGISASGNDSYDPTIGDTGIGGLSEGNYQLRMDFRPPAAGVLRDGTGTAIDGNADGAPDGVFNFWFRPAGTSNTKFVDKSAAAGGNGSITAPFKNIKDALAAAVPGDVVRIAGNGGADGRVDTAGDNLAYEVGFDSLGNALPDGSTFTVPKDVSVMIDAGAVLKMRRSRVGVGSTTVSVDKSGGSLLVLGTPKLLDSTGSVIEDSVGNPVAGSVFFTSANDPTLGKNANPAVVGIQPVAGDWGGLDFRNRIDSSLNREQHEVNGQFLNSVRHADLRYGGGQVVVDGTSQSITPVQMVDVRPTVAFSTITTSADAALGATPNSFLETNFQSPAEQNGASFSVDYDRVGPDLHYNRLVSNSINGLQIRVRTSGNPQLEKMTVQGRFDDTDVVHYLPENLEIQGTPGGALLRNDVPVGTPTPTVTRLDARLAIDAGTVIKSQGSRIDVGFGSQLIAEGDDGLPVVFTSINDVRYGAGGTFDTANRAGAKDAVDGDWGGIFVGHTSKASLDYSVVAFGGGTTRVQGGFSDFNAIEVHQGDLRLTNSRLEHNDTGSETSTSPGRGGHGTNDVGTVFVRGAQPIIADNIIQGNLGPAISANVSSLNHSYVDDPGRSRGRSDKIEGVVGNQGPLVAFNRIDDNDINGMVVRGGNLTTEGVWDDTDIVHVALDEIVVPDYHAYGGVRLISAADESLVVKFDGPTAGFTATGDPIDNADRIGGSVQVIGNPEYPVIMTSLDDCSVGAGFTVAGMHQVDTNNTGFCTGNDTVDFADIIVVIDESASMGFAQQFSVGLMASLDASLQQAGIGNSAAGGNLFGLVGYGSANQVPRSLPVGTGGELFGTSTEYATAAGNLVVDGFTEDGYQAIHFALDNYEYREGAAKFMILVTNEDRDVVDASLTYDNTLSRLLAEDVTLEGIVSADFFDEQGNFALGLDAQSNAYTEDGNGGFIVTPNGSVSSFFFDTTIPDYVDMVFDTNGLAGDINQIAFGGLTAESFGNAMVSSIVVQAGGNPAAAGDWRSVLLDTYSNDRNVAAVTETESPLSTPTGTNDSTSSSQFLGSLAPDLKSGDENQRLGFNLQGDLAKPGDVDVFSFRANAGTEVWLDIDRTNNAIDTVVELVDADGGILALSDDSLSEEANGGVAYFDPTRMPVQSVNPLRKSSPEFYYSSALGAPKDLYSTNPKDAGMRVVLPGDPGSNNLYHVRVRSGNSASTDAATRLLSLQDPALVAAGLTKGSYQLQIRLDEVDEVPGSSLSYADIRFAINGVQLVGVPGNSPLLGENSEVEINPNGVQNDLFANAQPLGNLLATNRQALSVAGNLDDFTDVDWFSFVLDYQKLTPTALREYFATVFDVDYADGIGRPDTSLYVFDAAGNLLLGGLGSDLVDDQASPSKGADNSDLSRGSSGSLDPFIGAYELPVGTYFLAVTNSDMVPEVVATYTDPNSTSPLVRLQPVEGVQLIAEDHVGFSGGSTALPPQIPVLFDTNEAPLDFNLSDVVLYVTQDVGQERTNVYQVNPFTGQVRGQVGRGDFDIQDVAFRPNGELRAFDRSVESNVGNADRDGFLDYINIDPGTGVFTATAAPIQTSHIEFAADGTITVVASDDGVNPEAITFAVLGGQERGLMVGNRPTPFGEDPFYSPGTRPLPNVGTSRPGVSFFTNVIFEFDENTGQATSAPAQDKTDNAVGFGTGTAIRERGYIETYTLDPLTGLPVTQSNQLVASEVTQSAPNTGANFLISDGQVFSVIDAGGFITRFEFDTGPEVLVNYDPTFGPTVTDGMKFSLDGQDYEFEIVGGTPGVIAGAIPIPLPQNATLRQFVDAIASNVVGATVSYEAGRMNFSGANTGNFTELELAGVFTNLGSSGAVAGGNIAVRVLASDTAETVAARIVQAVNAAGIATLNANATGDIVNFFGATVQNAGPLKIAGIGPGGLVTGIAVIGNTMFAVSDEGGLYSVNNPTALRTGNVATYVNTSYELTGIEFTALVAGPDHASGGALANMLFGLDSSGNLHAFDTNGRLQPLFANGATSISTGLFNANGLALSTLDFNLWHTTGQRNGDAGHGLPSTPNDSRGTFTGGSSLYFGYEGPGPNGVPNLSGPNSTGLQDSYDFPGGAAGALESAPFSLAGISEGDLPTLYFNYRFDTEQASSNLPIGSNADDYMRDSLRVYVSGEDGQWILAATNNDPSGNGSFDDEFDPFVSGNPDVQPLFDNNGQWRQARVPLDLFAGQEHVKLRMEFSSAGGFGYGRQGGKGPEIRTITGDRLVDGESLLVNGQLFEIEMGPSLTLPGGSAITSGESVTIDGARYVFTDGSTTVTAPDVAVIYQPGMSAELIAAALQQAILGSAVVPNTVSGLNYNHEPNDVLNFAEATGITGDSIEVIGNGQIGDNAALADLAEDVDLFRVDLDRGATVTVDALAAAIGSGLDTYLRVFDAEGRPLRNAFGGLIQNDNRPGSTDSLLSFTAAESGIYYIGVSGAGNQTYNAAVSGNALPANSTGNYRLSITVQRRLVPTVAGNRLQLDGARNVLLDVGSSITRQGGLGANGEPVYVSLDMTRAQVAAALQKSIADYFAGGETDAYPIRGGDTLELTGLSSFGIDAGPFGLTTSFVGDLFSAFNTGTNFDGTTNNARPGALGAQNNDFEGVYLDDFIIGIAGRGEMILNATAGNTNFIQDPQKSISNPDQFNPEILVGPYQFEIRGGDTYGLPLLDGFPVTLDLLETEALRSRSGSGVSVTFNPAAAMVAGDTFTVSDGTRVLTFEMDDVNDQLAVQPGNIALTFNTRAIDPLSGAVRSESARVLAARFRDLINSPTLQAQLNVTANLLTNDGVGATSPTVVLIGQASANVPTSVGQVDVSTNKSGSNRERPQGQVVVNGVRISNSLDFGVSILAADRVTSTDPLLDTNAPNPGSPRNTVTINTDRLAPGAVIMNSEFISNRAGGINVSGDPLVTNVPSAAVPFVRLVNNTVIGGTVSSVVGLNATVEGGQIFEVGNLAFADSVFSYTPLSGGGPGPIAGLDDETQALGPPNYSGNGEPLVGEGVVSLGRGGQIVLQFTNNLLTGSGDGNPDLMVFEVGDSEEVLVEVSSDGNRYTAVGRASAASPTLDIDAFGFNRNSRLAFVRLTDVANQGSQSGDSVGADIDAVGAISSVAVENYNPGGTGISVTNNGTATLLNNVIVNSGTGINVDASSTSTVVGGTIFQRNSANLGGSATLGQFSTVVGENVPMFVSAGVGNLYPAPASPMIDASIDSLEDRQSLVAVKRPLGLAASPILAPQFDINGQLRVDDPTVDTPSGLGEDVFKDRGAQDRADFIGPSVVLQNPIDNDVAGLDGNPAESIVELTGVTPHYFDIQLTDGLEPSDPSNGSGVNNLTVSSRSILVYRNNVPLVEGVDYRFGYDSTNGVIRLQPLAGIWKSESVYTVRFLNSKEASIVASEASVYTDGDQFEVVDASSSSTRFEFDLGYLVKVPSANGIDADLADGTTFKLDDGSRVLTFEFDREGFVSPGNVRVSLGANPTIESTARAIEFAITDAGMTLTATEVSPGRVQILGSRLVRMDVETSGLEVTGQPGVQTVFGIQIPLEAGRPTGVVDGQTFTIDRSGAPVSFELDTNGITLPGNIPVRYFDGASAAQIGAALVLAIDNAALGLSPSYDGNGLVRLGGDSNTRLDMTNTALLQTGLAGQTASISIPLPADATAPQVATLIKSSIEAQNLAGVTLTQFGNRLVVEGALGVGGVGAGQILAIRDRAGNTLKPNQVDGSTTVTIFLGEGLDYGDAPAPYLSTNVQDGPRHTVVTGLSLGATVTPDADAKLPDADFDDGLTFTSGLFAAFQANASVPVTNTTGGNAYMSLWVDFNGDGAFSATERIVNSQLVTQPTTNLSFLVPSSAVAGDTYARIRLSSNAAAVASPLGSAPDGEVEDWAVTIQGNPYTNQSFNLDVNGDGSVSPIDVLQVINWINDPAKPQFLSLAQATNAPPYIDVNGDGIVSAGDVVLVVNYLNSLPPSGEGEFASLNSSGSGQLPQGFQGEDTVLASDWAAGLENVLVNNRKPTQRPQVANDLAMLEDNDDSRLLAADRPRTEVGTGIDDFWAGLGDDDDQDDETDELNESLIIDLLG